MNIIEETIDELNEIMERFEIKCPLKDCRDDECVREVLRTHHKESIQRVLEELREDITK